jgi:NAD(P)-dependent dehydrogenase (short-subunit alcohol dehydrogenase family)
MALSLCTRRALAPVASTMRTATLAFTLPRTLHQYRSFSSASASASTKQASKSGRMSGKVAIVTGGSAGIGRETAMLFAKENARGLVVVDKNEAGGQETVELIKKSGFNNVVFQAADVSKSSDVEKFVQVAEKQFGGLHVLFNNAGIMHMDDDNAETTTDKVWDLTFNINVKGVFYGCKYAIPAIRRSGGGSIINTASFVALLGAATPQLAYTSSKGAVLAMSRELAVIHARDNIRVNALCPGPLRTKLLMDFLDTEEKKQRRLVHVPMGRFGEAKEMASAVLFLASDESSFVTGTDFVVDGGITAAYVTPLGETKSLPPQ